VAASNRVSGSAKISARRSTLQAIGISDSRMDRRDGPGRLHPTCLDLDHLTFKLGHADLHDGLVKPAHHRLRLRGLIARSPKAPLSHHSPGATHPDLLPSTLLSCSPARIGRRGTTRDQSKSSPDKGDPGRRDRSRSTVRRGQMCRMTNATSLVPILSEQGYSADIGRRACERYRENRWGGYMTPCCGSSRTVTLGAETSRHHRYR
jgi:hypothetical protein